MKKINSQLILLLSVVFIDLLGFGIVIPIIPVMVEDLAKTNGLVGVPLIVGIIIGVYSFFQFLFSPILGRLSDKYGRRPILLASTIINCIGYGIIFFSHSLPVLILGRILGGIGSANLSVVQAYVADTSESHERTKRLALIGSVFGLGFIFGPLVGGYTAAEFDIHAPFLLTSIFALLNTIFIFFMLPESNKSLQQHIKIELVNFKVIQEVLKPKNMAFLIFLFFLINLTLALIIGVLPLFSEQKFGWDEKQNGYFFMAIGVASFLMQSIVIRFLLKYFNEPKLIQIGMIIFGIANIGIGLAITQNLLLAAGSLSAVGFSLMNANLQALISLESKPGEQGMVMGVAQSFAAFARVLGPIIGGGLATALINLPYFVSGAAVFLVFIWGYKNLKLHKTTNH